MSSQPYWWRRSWYTPRPSPASQPVIPEDASTPAPSALRWGGVWGARECRLRNEEERRACRRGVCGLRGGGLGEARSSLLGMAL